MHPHPRLSVRVFASFIGGIIAIVLALHGSVVSDVDRESADPTPDDPFAPLDLPEPTRERGASGAPGPHYWEQRADYEIHAELDAPNRRVQARAIVTYTNRAPESLPFIWLHLEQNTHRPDGLAATLNGVKSELTPGGIEPTGGLQLRAVRLVAERGELGAELPLRIHGTLARLELPAPLASGGTVRISLQWSIELPRDGLQRMGVESVGAGDIFQVAQWFPSIVKYDDVHGWNTLPYIDAGEFYPDFGDYTVSITVPRSHLVSATGVLRNAEQVLTPAQRERLARAAASRDTVFIRSADEVGDPATRPAGDGPLTWRFEARNVRTFAWASSGAFAWDAASVENTGAAALGLPERVLCQSFYPAEGAALWGRPGRGPEAGGATDMLAFSIEHYARQWYPYPYPVASNVNGYVPGMEYPMIVFCSERADERGLFGVTTHEIGHTWFPMLVNTDERRHAWMDEGLNSFMNGICERERYPSTGPGDESASRSLAREFAQGLHGNPIATWPDRMRDRELGFLAYGKPAAMMDALRDVVLGPERFDPAFRAYIRRWAFKSPQPADFFRTMESEAGMDLAWFWRGWIYRTDLLDQAIEDVVEIQADAKGTEPGEAEEVVPHTVIAISSQGRAARDNAVPHESAPGAEPPWRARGLIMPILLRIEYSDGAVEDRAISAEVWTRGRVWRVRVPTSPEKRVVRVTLDPDDLLPDAQRENNTWSEPR